MCSSGNILAVDLQSGGLGLTIARPYSWAGICNFFDSHFLGSAYNEQKHCDHVMRNHCSANLGDLDVYLFWMVFRENWRAEQRVYFYFLVNNSRNRKCVTSCKL